MPTINFCPRCGSLLIPKRMNGEIKSFCPRCGAFAEDMDVVTTTDTETATDNSNFGITDPDLREEFPLFPYSDIREGQLEFMRDIRYAAEKGITLLAQAPTGIGKTAATLSVLMDVAMKTDKTVFFLTSKQSQHHIAVETLKKMAKRSTRPLKVIDIISKQDMCPAIDKGMPSYAFMEFCKNRVKTHTCDYYNTPNGRARARILSHIMHVEEMISMCVSMDVCPHKAALDAASEADVIICDYNYIFSDLNEGILDRLGRELEDIILIVDEAHNLPDRIREHQSSEITTYKLDEAAKEIRPRDPRTHKITVQLGASLQRWVKKIPAGQESYVKKSELLEELESILSEGLENAIDIGVYIDALLNAGDSLLSEGYERSYALELGEFLQNWMTSDRGMARILVRQEGDNWTLKMRFLDPSIMAAGIFRSVSSAVLMSGTLYPPQMYGDILGIRENRGMVRVYTSPFPPENRQTFILRGVSTQYKKRGPQMYEKIAHHIIALYEGATGNVAAFFPSYQILDEVSYKIMEISSSIPIIVEERSMTKSEREQIIARLKRYTGSGAVLLAVQGGSLSEGIDYKDNLLSAIAVVGIPLAPPNLEVKGLMAYYQKLFGKDKGEMYSYLYPAINKVIQSAGRLIRSETDRGVVALMDERFLMSRYRGLLPPELNGEVASDIRDFRHRVESFFRMQ